MYQNKLDLSTYIQTILRFVHDNKLKTYQIFNQFKIKSAETSQV